MDDRAIVARVKAKLGITLPKKREEYDEQERLIVLDLSGLGIKEVPVELAQLSHLQQLYLNNNPDLLTPPPK